MGPSLSLVLLVAGAALLALVALDVVATTTGSGSGRVSSPLTARVSRRLWGAALAVHRRRPSHRSLHLFGLVLTIGIVISWILGVWIAWTLIFASAEGSVVEATTSRPTDLGGKAYFAGYSVLTLGNGELEPTSGGWRMATLAAAGTGLGLVTLAVTYILNVVQAGNRRRSLATVIWTLGDTPQDLVERATEDPTNVSQQLWSLIDPLAMVREQHVAFPVLHYLHATDRRRALPVQVAKLADAVERLRSGRAAPDLSPSVLASTARALGEFARTVGDYVPNDADPLGEEGIDTNRLLRSAGWDVPDRP